MKKLILSLMALLGLGTAHADEGMWTIYNLPPQVFEKMQEEGFRMSYNDLYLGENSLKNAVVNFSGYCSGVVVSPDGLVFTNHHCGFEAIRSHSTVEHDYMLNGFYAKSYAEELPNKDMFVSFMVEQDDITDRVLKLGYETMNNEQRALLLDSLENVELYALPDDRFCVNDVADRCAEIAERLKATLDAPPTSQPPAATADDPNP